MNTGLAVFDRNRAILGKVLMAFFVSLACFIFVLVPTKAFAAIDEIEPNDSFDTATPINMNQVVYGITDGEEERGKEDVFIVDLPITGSVKIVLTNDRYAYDGWPIELMASNRYYESYGFLEKVKTNNTRPTSFTFNLKKGINYIRINSWTGNHPYHFKLTYVIPGTVMKKVAPAKRAFTATWTKKSGASSYQIRYSTKSSMNGAKTVNVSKSSKSKKIKKLKSNKKYYVQVRVAKNIGGQTYWSSWSSRKSVRTK